MRSRWPASVRDLQQDVMPCTRPEANLRQCRSDMAGKQCPAGQVQQVVQAYNTGQERIVDMYPMGKVRSLKPLVVALILSHARTIGKASLQAGRVPKRCSLALPAPLPWHMEVEKQPLQPRPRQPH